ncbi:MAG: anthranilate synthase component II [Bdellovibrionales bacterium]
MFLIIDNYDSFVHNLARYVALAGGETHIIRNDAITLQGIAALKPQAIILSPGPCAPKDAGVCIDTVKIFGETVPILGVCLGHQVIGEAYGGQTIKTAPVHGQSNTITHTAEGVFSGIPSPLEVGRYHSLITQLSTDTPLHITAQTNDGIIMAVQHKTHPVYGVQFHPESVLTEHGQAIVDNFVKIANNWNQQKNVA